MDGKALTAQDSFLIRVIDVWKSGQVLLPEVIRWSKYVNAEDSKVRKQNSLQHSHSISVFATIFLTKTRSYLILDEELVKDAVHNHDHGEGELKFDTLYIDKTEQGDLDEYLAFAKRFSNLEDQDLFFEFQRPFLLQFALKNPEIFPEDARKIMSELAFYREKECKAFDAIERLDYLLFAFEQYNEVGDEVILVQTLRGQIPHLNNLADNGGIALDQTFWTPEFRAWCENFVAEREGQFIEVKGEK